MRDYAKVEPKMWHGATMKALRRCPEGVIVGMYLMTSPQSNMLGLFSQPVLYMAHETGLGLEGAMKGLKHCIESGFCSFDEDSEFVWVHEMARYQIASELKANDLRCKGIQKDYDNLPDNPFLAAFFDRYAAAFHLTNKRGMQGASQAPTKPLRSQEQEQEQEQDTSGKGGKPPADKPKAQLWKAAVSLLAGQGMPEPQARTFIGRLAKDYPHGDIVQKAVEAAVSEQPPDARACLKATCQRLAGEQKKQADSSLFEGAV